MAFHLIICFSLFLLLSSTLLFLIKGKNKYKNPSPGPPGLPVIGNLHQLGPLRHQSFSKLSKKYGPVLFLRLGSVPTVIASSADSAREVLKTNDIHCCSRPLLAATAKFSYGYRNIGFSPYGDYWREIRKICVLHLFSAKRVQSFGFIREEEVDLMIKSISHRVSSTTGSASVNLQATPDAVVDVGEMLMSLTADITCRMSFGKNMREKGGIDMKRFQKLIKETAALIGSFYASDVFPYFGWIIDAFRGLHTKRERIFHELDGFYQGMIDDHLSVNRSKEKQEDDIIDVLLNLQSTGSNTTLQLTHSIIKAVLSDMFLAGLGTVVTTLSWAIAELVKNPRVMKKVQEEIRKQIENKEKVLETDIHHLSYLKAVIKEVYRLHPVAVLLLPRETISEFQINGYNIYPGTRVHVNVWAIGRDPSIWKDPEAFFPERFVDNNIDYKGQDFEFLPFGAGRRGCPGMLMAASVVELVLANLLYCFDWKLPNEMRVEDFSMEEAPGISVNRKETFKLVPIKYQFPSSEDC